MTFINRKCVLPKYQPQGPHQLSRRLLPSASQWIPHAQQNATMMRVGLRTGQRCAMRVGLRNDRPGEATPSALPELRPALPAQGSQSVRGTAHGYPLQGQLTPPLCPPA